MSAPIATTARSKSRDAELAQRLVVGGVGLDDVGEVVGPALDERRVLVDGEHFLPMLHQRLGDGGAEPAQADDDHGRGVGLLS